MSLSNDAFLSHSSAQSGFVQHLGGQLTIRRLDFSSSKKGQGAEYGKWFDESLVPRVTGAKVVVFVLSLNFLDSKWSVKELGYALHAARQCPDKKMIPIFYKCSPAEFNAAFSSDKTQANIRKWWEGDLQSQQGLSPREPEDASRYHGFQGLKYDNEAELVGDAVAMIERNLYVPKYPEQYVVAKEQWVKAAVQQLQQHGALGVHGLGGIGKTTLTKLVHNHLQEQHQQDFTGRIYCAEVSISKVSRPASTVLR